MANKLLYSHRHPSLAESNPTTSQPAAPKPSVAPPQGGAACWLPQPRNTPSTDVRHQGHYQPVLRPQVLLDCRTPHSLHSKPSLVGRTFRASLNCALPPPCTAHGPPTILGIPGREFKQHIGLNAGCNVHRKASNTPRHGGHGPAELNPALTTLPSTLV